MKVSRKKAFVCILLVLTLCMSMFSFGVSAANSANANIIHQVSILDVCAPYAEYYPDYDFTLGLPKAYTFDTDRVNSDTCVYNGCWWYDETDKMPIDYDDAFIKGHIYSLIVLLEPCEGYEFQVDNYDTPFIKGYVNGNVAVVDESLTGRYSACIKYTFDPSDYNMEVETVKLTVSEPKAGECPDFSAKTDRTAVEIGTMASPHYIEGVAWYDCDNHVFLDPSDKFAEDGNYEVYVVIKTTGDFYFSTAGANSDVQVKVNGQLAEVGFSGEDLNHYLLVTYVFGGKFTEVSKVEIRNLTVPAAGANPDFDLTPFVDYAYYINAIYWTDKDQSGHPVTMKETDTFEAGHTYELQVWLRVKDGYKFRLDEDDCVDMVAYIDSKQAEVVLPGAETSAIITMEYKIPESRVISEVDVIGVDAPYTGRTPDYEAFCTTKGCNVTWVKWYDVTDGEHVLMGEDDTFIEGRTYRVNVMVEAEGDYTFLMVDRYNEAGGYINGKKAIAGAADEDFWLQLGYIFPECEGNIEIPTEPTTPDEMPTTPTETTSPDEKPTDSTTPSEDTTETTPSEPAETTETTESTATDPAGTTEATEATVTEPKETINTTETTTDANSSDPVEDKGISGDVDGNGKVNIKDATMIQKAVAKIISFSDAEFIRADVNADTNVNIKDATAIQKYVAKIETGLPIGEIMG